MAGRFGPFALPWVPPQSYAFMPPSSKSTSGATSSYGLGSGYGWGAPPMPEPLHWHEFTVFDIVQPTPPDLKAMEESIRNGLAALTGADYLAFTTPANPLPHPHLPWDHYRRPIAHLRFAIGKRGAWTDREKRVVLARMREGLAIGGVTGMKDWRVRGQRRGSAVEETVGSSSSSSRSNEASGSMASGSTGTGTSSSGSSVTCSTCYPSSIERTARTRTSPSGATRAPLARKAMKMVPGAEPANYRVSRWLVKDV